MGQVLPMIAMQVAGAAISGAAKGAVGGAMNKDKSIGTSIGDEFKDMGMKYARLPLQGFGMLQNFMKGVPLIGDMMGGGQSNPSMPRVGGPKTEQDWSTLLLGR